MSAADFELLEPTYGDAAAPAAGDRQEPLTALEELVAGCSQVAAAGHNNYEGMQVRERRRAALKNLTVLAEIRRLTEAAIIETVAVSRQGGSQYGYHYDYGVPTWEEIGKALGITKQSAQGRFGGRK